MDTLLKTKREIDWILRIYAALLFGLTLVYMFTIWNLGFHSDSAAANILAREQMRTGKLFPETWNTSSGLFIFFYNILIIPLSIFTKNQILLRNLAVAIVLIVFVLLLRCLSKGFLNSNFYLVALCFFFSNTSYVVMDMAFAQAAYLPSITYSVILLILLFKAFDERLVVKQKRWLAILMLFIVYLALYGTINLAYQIIPLLGAIVLYFVLEYGKRSLGSIRKELSNAIKAVAAVIVAAAVGIVGYRGLATYTGFRSGANITYPDDSEIGNAFIQYTLRAIGYKPNVKLFSLAGLMNAVILLGFIAVLACCVLLFRKYWEQPFAVKILMHFGLITNIIHIYFVFTTYCLDLNNIRYWFRPLIFLWILAAYYIYTYILSQGFLLKVVAIAALVAFSGPCMLSSLPEVVHYPDNRTNQMGLVNFLKDHGLTHGYATFWNAGKNMVLSDFDIEIGGVMLTRTILPQYWLSITTTYDPAAYSGESFLLLSQSENRKYSGSFGMQVLGEPQEVLTYEDYMIYKYSYNIAKNGFQGNSIQDLEVTGNMVVSDLTMRQEDGTISLTAGQTIYGPYMLLPAGCYEIDLEFAELEEDVFLRLTSDAGANVWREEILREKVQTIDFEAAEDLTNFEVVLATGRSAVLKSVKISQIK